MPTLPMADPHFGSTTPLQVRLQPDAKRPWQTQTPQKPESTQERRSCSNVVGKSLGLPLPPWNIHIVSRLSRMSRSGWEDRSAAVDALVATNRWRCRSAGRLTLSRGRAAVTGSPAAYSDPGRVSARSRSSWAACRAAIAGRTEWALETEWFPVRIEVKKSVFWRSSAAVS